MIFKEKEGKIDGKKIKLISSRFFEIAAFAANQLKQIKEAEKGGMVFYLDGGEQLKKVQRGSWEPPIEIFVKNNASHRRGCIVEVGERNPLMARRINSKNLIRWTEETEEGLF
jgi:hypothetical protein